jgi:hypothetical protein
MLHHSPTQHNEVTKKQKKKKATKLTMAEVQYWWKSVSPWTSASRPGIRRTREDWSCVKILTYLHYLNENGKTHRGMNLAIQSPSLWLSLKPLPEERIRASSSGSASHSTSRRQPCHLEEPPTLPLGGSPVTWRSPGWTPWAPQLSQAALLSIKFHDSFTMLSWWLLTGSWKELWIPHKHNLTL